MITFGEPGGRILPVGLGMGATQEAWFTRSPTRAAGRPPMSTVVEPMAMMPGPAGMQDGRRHGSLMDDTTAAGKPLMSTVGTPFPMSASGRGG